MTIYILKYNNYYNRILKRELSIASYTEFIHFVYERVNFNPNDGVDTNLVVGAGEYDGEGDYLIVADDRDQIKSRWYIIEAVRTRAGQYQVSLHRDLLADYYDDMISAPAFIEKAIVPDSNPLIYNSEMMSFNQIKKGELLIQDRSRCPWIVGYYAKNTPNEQLSGSVDVNTDGNYDLMIDVPFSAWEFNATVTPFYIQPEFNELQIYIHLYSDLVTPKVYYKFDRSAQWRTAFTSTTATLEGDLLKRGLIGDRLADQIRPNLPTLIDQILNDYSGAASYEDSYNFLSLNGRTVKDANGEIYAITLSPLAPEDQVIDLRAGSVFNELKSTIAAVNQMDGTLIRGYASTDSFKAKVTQYGYTMHAEKLEEATAHWDLTGSKQLTEDAPYNIFAIPMGSVKLTGVTGEIGTSSEQYAMATAESMIRTMGSNLYDIQLLPYCPVFLQNQKEINVKTNHEYALVTGPAPDRDFLTFILNVPKARFSNFIEKRIDQANVKISNECDLYKLCSPNWASEFQFSVVKNGGVSGFDIDCEYRPYTPYIHVAPRFGGLYGRDFNDARGLICSGDFSLSQIQDNWQQYQISNKNFQNIFDRQIENMEVQHRYQRIGDIAGAVTGTMSGASSGAAAGTAVSPGIGTAIGAGVGAIASGIGGAIDYRLKEQLRSEALDYTKDLFGFQLDNIKALPYTLTKVTAYNNNNKIFPILEYYTCTEVEKKALAMKIIYNSMTVGVIGTVQDYLSYTWSYYDQEQGYLYDKGYIKAQLIRLDGIGEDYHVANAIAGELAKGVYTK